MTHILRRTWLVVLLAAFGLVHPAAAHTLSESHSSWHISGKIVGVTETIIRKDAVLIPPASQNPTEQQIAAYVGKNIWVTAGNNKKCKRNVGPESEPAQAGYYRVHLEFLCPTDKNIELHSSVLFKQISTHVDYAQIVTSKGDFVEQMFTADQQKLPGSTEGQNPLQSAGFLTYIWLGIHHIWTGIDHMSFLLGLILISRRLRDLAFVITGFTLGHSVTLALAVTGLIRPHPEYIDALIALTIMMIALENIADTTGKPFLIAVGLAAAMFAMAAIKALGLGGLPVLLLLGAGIFGANYLMISGRLQDAARLRVVVTVVFGLIHGFGFAATLLEMRLPTGKLAELLFGFNTGVEIGQLSLVLGVVALVAILAKLKLTLPRPIVVDVCSAILVCIGVFWFVSRSYAVA